MVHLWILWGSTGLIIVYLLWTERQANERRRRSPREPVVSGSCYLPFGPSQHVVPPNDSPTPAEVVQGAMDAPVRVAVSVSGSQMILPCPFCGGSDIDVEYWMSVDRSGPGCNTCSATAETLQMWNTRACASSQNSVRQDAEHPPTR